MIIFSLGISGSGKSFYGERLKEKFPRLNIICPDDIRASFRDISNQSNNQEVFNIINHQLSSAMARNEMVYYSATNLTKKNRKGMIELCKKYNQEVICVVFLTSFRPDICENRVRSNLSNGINRSNTLVKTDDGETVIRMQWKKFCNQMKDIGGLEEVLKWLNYKIKYIECGAK